MLMLDDTPPRTKSRLRYCRRVPRCSGGEIRGLRAKAVLAGMRMGVADRASLVCAVVLRLVSTDSRGRRRVRARRIVDTIARQGTIRER